ncbi:hypothetical protein IJ472_05785 [bacterium]|nr:hypothetical protein [bacterium]
MAISDLNDGVGKKIVEALKMQSAAHGDGEVFVNDDTPEIIEETVVEETPVEVSDDFGENSYYETQVPSDMQMRIQSQLQYQAATQPQTFVDAAFQQSLVQNLGMNAFASQDDFDYPANVAVLKQLISKLPAGVSKQTGALIIKQTMEALGISMGSVLQEAKQVQESLVTRSVECQNSVADYRKQITILEAKAQNYQKQASVMNDIISLFIQAR